MCPQLATPEPGLAELPSDIPAEILETVEYVDMDAEIEDHSRLGRDWIQLKELTTSVAAGNNCFAASHEILRMIIEDIGCPDGYDVDTIEVPLFTDCCHHAVVMTSKRSEDEAWIIDYTYRQFDEACDFPLVQDRASWLRSLHQWENDNLGMAW